MLLPLLSQEPTGSGQGDVASLVGIEEDSSLTTLEDQCGQSLLMSEVRHLSFIIYCIPLSWIDEVFN